MKLSKNHRPELLTALCILTFIGSSMAFLVYLTASLFYEKASGIIIEYSSWNSVEPISPLYFLAFALLYLTSLAGAIRMWKLHRDGFFLYTISQLVIMFLPVIWLDWNSFSVTGAIFTAVFAGGYAMNWKWLN